ncbi:malate dehydrogenase [Chloroflexota bacterium]
MSNKVSVIGTGNVGATCAQRVAQGDYADVVLLDIVNGMPQGKAIDMMHSHPIVGSTSSIIGTNKYEDTAGSDVVVITSGSTRKPGMDRRDLAFTNAEVIKSVVPQVLEHSPYCVMIMVTNPLDAMAYLALKLSKLPKNRVMGMSGVLDTARFRAIIAAELDVSVEDVSACILGAHGDTMAPIPRLTTVGCVPITELLSKEKIDVLVDSSIHSGAEIVGLLKNGSAFYAPGVSAAQMAEAVVLDSKRILPVAAYLEGEFGLSGIYLGVPAKVGAGGVEQILEFELTADEKAALEKSAQSVRDLITDLDLS